MHIKSHATYMMKYVGLACLHFWRAPPDTELKHELLDRVEEDVDRAQARRDDHVARRVGRHERVACTAPMRYCRLERQ